MGVRFFLLQTGTLLCPQESLIALSECWPPVLPLPSTLGAAAPATSLNLSFGKILPLLAWPLLGQYPPSPPTALLGNFPLAVAGKHGLFPSSPSLLKRALCTDALSLGLPDKQQSYFWLGHLILLDEVRCPLSLESPRGAVSQASPGMTRHLGVLEARVSFPSDHEQLEGRDWLSSHCLSAQRRGWGMFVAGGEDGWTNRRRICLWVSPLSDSAFVSSFILLPQKINF